ncbi:hypothetical protein BH23PLA1_BH23PLA1_18120 [soil metagenome]
MRCWNRPLKTRLVRLTSILQTILISVFTRFSGVRLVELVRGFGLGLKGQVFEMLWYMAHFIEAADLLNATVGGCRSGIVSFGGLAS